MEKIIKYVSNDGEEFATKIECEEHENSLDITKNSGIIMLDENFTRPTTGVPDELNCTEYLFLRDKSDLENYNKCAYYFGCTVVDETTEFGWFRYNYTFDVWKCLGAEIQKLLSLSEKLEEVRRNMNENN